MKSMPEQIECVKREIRFRQYVYPRRIDAGKMSPAKAAHELESMQAVLATLEALPKEQGTLGL